MDIELQKGEILLKKGHANRYVHRLLWTGSLFLTNQRIEFVTHPLNFQNYSITIPLKKLKKIEFKYNRKYFTHGFWIHQEDGDSVHLAVWRRKKWKKAIDAAKKKIEEV